MHPAVHRKGAEECRRSHKGRDAELGADPGHRLHVRRVGDDHNRRPFDEAKEHVHRKPERVEERKLRKHHVGLVRIENARQLLAVSNHIVMRQLDSLRNPFRPRTEENRRGIRQPDFLEVEELDEERGEDDAHDHVEEHR